MAQKILSGRRRTLAVPRIRRRGHPMIAGLVIASAGLILAGGAPSSTAALPGSGASGSNSSTAALSNPALLSVTASAESVVAFNVEAAGVVARGVTLSHPVSGARVSSAFGPRVNPMTGFGQEFHTGTDFAAACGTRVTAADDGIVTEAGLHAHGGGQRIVVDHGRGMRTTYNHLNSMDVVPGTAVRRDAVLGTVGSTGSSTGCHLHFEVVVNEVTVDPQPWL